MAQHDYVIDNSTGANVRADINAVLQAIATNNSGSSAPSATVASQFFADTNAGIMKLRNTANNGYVNLFTLAGGIDVDASSNFNEDVTFQGASANIGFDKSQNSLEFEDAAQLKFGAGDDLKIHHTGGVNIIDAATNATIKFQRSGSDVFELKSTGFQGLDNKKIMLGNADDLSIFHNGTNSFISNTTGLLQIDSDAEVQINATLLRVKNAADSELMATFLQDAGVDLYHNNVRTFRTQTNGIASVGGENNDAYIYLFADEGDDNADQWRLQALASDSKLEFRNRDDGNYRINAEMVGSGHVKLYNDNSQRFATFAGGSIVYGQWRQADTIGNTRTMKSVVTNGLASGETLSFQDTSLNFHGFGEVTVILRHNSTSTQATMKKFPISIRSTANAGVGSAIYTQNAATAGQSFTVAGIDRGVNVTNNESHSCTCTVILDLIIFA